MAAGVMVRAITPEGHIPFVFPLSRLFGIRSSFFNVRGDKTRRSRIPLAEASLM